MTFYNVISAILFLGAFKELLLAIAAEDWAKGLAAGTFSLLMFNDAVFTSWAVEQRRIDYKPSLMLLDSANFLIVSSALLWLNPYATNVFGVSFEKFAETLNEQGFWPGCSTQERSELAPLVGLQA